MRWRIAEGKSKKDKRKSNDIVEDAISATDPNESYQLDPTYVKNVDERAQSKLKERFNQSSNH